MTSDIKTLAATISGKAKDIEAQLPRGYNRSATVTLDTEELWDIVTTLEDAAGDIEDLANDIKDIIGR